MPPESANHINWATALFGGTLSCALLPAAYVIAHKFSNYAKEQFLAYSLFLMSTLAMVLSILLVGLNALNENAWMSLLGKIAGYNSEYTYLSYNTTTYQHCRNITSAECDLGFNGIPASYYLPSENMMNMMGKGFKSSFNFFTGYGAV